MLSKFLSSRRTPILPEGIVPPGRRLYAVGDIHGRADLLADLLEQIAVDDAGRSPADTTIIFLGDLVDRGPDSAQVVEQLRVLAETTINLRFLMGNHEEVFLRALAGDLRALRMFCKIGGRETILSYGLDPVEYDRLDYAELLEAVQTIVPDAHRVFLSAFEDMIVIGDYAFVHAGVEPQTPLADQSTADLRWIRQPFLDYRGKLEKIIVHGHTILPDVDYRPHRIGIDTGAYASGRLTALGLEDGAMWQHETRFAA